MLSTIIHSATMLHSALLADSIFTRAHRGQADGDLIELTFASKAIEFLRREILNPETGTSDAIIWSVVIFGYSGKIADLRSGTRMPRQSPLKELQTLHVYGRMEYSPEHVRGLLALIEMIGGIDKIQTPGMGQVISYAGLLGACRALTKPLFPFLAHGKHFSNADTLTMSMQELECQRANLVELGSGFAAVWQDTESPELLGLVNAIENLAKFTVILESFISGKWSSRSHTNMIDARNFSQHQVMSLATQTELSDDGIVQIDEQYECTRLGLVAYSLLVVFPLPPVVGLFEQLSGRILAACGQVNQRRLNRDRLQLHLWCLTVGSIVSIGLRSHQDFVSEVKRVVLQVAVRGWQGFRRILRGFLWHSDTNDIDAMDLWIEVQK